MGANERSRDLGPRLALHQPHDGVHAAVYARVLCEGEVEQCGRRDVARGHASGEAVASWAR